MGSKTLTDFFKNLPKETLLIVYTDGACSGNPGPGGWGVVIYAGTLTHEWYGGEGDTTNNRMELAACIEALRAIPAHFAITMRTDSRYVQDGICHWMQGWKRNNWQTAAKKPVKNQDLWQQLDTLVQQHSITWEWVAGHSGNKGNDRADMLAKQGIVHARLKGC